MPAKTLMVQGVASHAGKSVIVTALCRIFAQDGYRVAPFKAWNMALNSYVTRDGLEIGRAQGVQAEAAGIDAACDMNPFLLKPKGNMTSQVIMRGRPRADVDSGEGRRNFVEIALPVIRESLEKLRGEFDIVVIEGAGSPAEINLRDRDVANMRVAKMVDAPVLLVADIDRGGALAAIVGTLILLPEDERRYVVGSVLNRFRGDVGILRPGIEALERRTGKPVLGVVPYMDGCLMDEEDSVSLERPQRPFGISAGKDLDIAVICLPHLSNFTDFDAFAAERDAGVRYVREGDALGNPDVIIIPGTKNTVSDLLHLRKTGRASEIVEKAAQGTYIVGICGGYQMLGRILRDPYGTEAGIGNIPGLGILPVETTFYPGKHTLRTRARVVTSVGWIGELAGEEVSGYEIHMGETRLYEGAEPVFLLSGRSEPEGAITPDGLVMGTYLHGLFDNDGLRRSFLDYLRCKKGLEPLSGRSGKSARALREERFDKLAELVRRSIDMERIYELLR